MIEASQDFNRYPLDWEKIKYNGKYKSLLEKQVVANVARLFTLKQQKKSAQELIASLMDIKSN